MASAPGRPPPGGGQVISSIAWFAAGLALGGLACWFAPRLWPRARALARARTPYLVAAGLIVAFAVAATIMHAALSSRRARSDDAAHAPAAMAPAGTTPSAAPAQSMQAAVAGLAARLARAGGTDADWELLAKGYEFLGRADEAQRARAHLASPSSDSGASTAGTMSTATLMAAVAAAGEATAPTAAVPPAARPAPSMDELRRAVADHPADAQAWADYADGLASVAGGSLTGAPGSAIDRALTLDPANPKALWLKASQAHEQRHFVDALAWWRRLRAVLPAGSPDAASIDANIAEDTQRAAGAQTAAVKLN